MSKVLRFLFLLALLAFGSHAFATVSPIATWKRLVPASPVVDGLSFGETQGNYKAYVDALLASRACSNSGYKSSGQVFIVTGSQAGGLIQYNFSTSHCSDPGIPGPFNNTDGNTMGTYQRNASASCPANSTSDGAGQCACVAGFDESGGLCVPHTNQCAADAGKSVITNWTLGWARTPDVSSNSPLIDGKMPTAGQKMCSGGCKVSIDPGAVAPGLGAYVSQTPTSQGLHRVSVDFVAQQTAEECSPDPEADKRVLPYLEKDAQCPGYVGEVNGVKGCYGTADKPVITQPNPAPGVPADAGNPQAGPKPTTGQGSGTGGVGRTPSTGVGGSTGGPAAASAGGKGTGAGTGTVAGQSNGTGRVGTQEGTEQANCGAPGQSPCKIDEEGTPADGSTSFAGARTELDTAKQSVETAIGNAHTMTAPSWTFSFQLPTGCSAYQVATFKGLTFSMNPCQYQPMIHDLLSMVWAAVTAFCIIGMVGRTIRES